MSQFTVDIRNFINKSNLTVERAVRSIVVLVAQEVITRTPVDTGRARANWVYGAGIANMTYDYGTFDPGGSQAIDRIANERFRPIVYLTNSLPYIQNLEDGSSRQAPTGMVAATMSDIGGKIERYLRTIS